MEDILNAAQEKINKAIEEEQEQGINYNNDTQPESTVKPSSVPEGTINHNPEALEMTEGTVDIINTELSEENLTLFPSGRKGLSVYAVKPFRLFRKLSA